VVRGPQFEKRCSRVLTEIPSFVTRQLVHTSTEADFKLIKVQQWLKNCLKPRNYLDVTAGSTVKIVLFRANNGTKNDVINGKYVCFITDRF